MAFEYKNNHERPMDCMLPKPIGTIRINPGQVVPTLEQEESGLTASLLEREGFIIKNLLTHTPAAERRSLLESAGLDVPQTILDITRFHPDFAGQAPSAYELPTEAEVDSILAPPTEPVEEPEKEPEAAPEPKAEEPVKRRRRRKKEVRQDLAADLADLRDIKNEVEADERDALDQQTIDEFQKMVDASCSSHKADRPKPENPA